MEEEEVEKMGKKWARGRRRRKRRRRCTPFFAKKKIIGRPLAVFGVFFVFRAQICWRVSFHPFRLHERTTQKAMN